MLSRDAAPGLSSIARLGSDRFDAWLRRLLVRSCARRASGHRQRQVTELRVLDFDRPTDQDAQRRPRGARPAGPRLSGAACPGARDPRAPSLSGAVGSRDRRRSRNTGRDRQIAASPCHAAHGASLDADERVLRLPWEASNDRPWRRSPDPWVLQRYRRRPGAGRSAGGAQPGANPAPRDSTVRFGRRSGARTDLPRHTPDAGFCSTCPLPGRRRGAHRWGACSRADPVA